ncbi:MAG: dienelactone hydrolase family protein [Anaerolineae bacterium]
MSSAQPDGYLALPTTGTGKRVLVLHAWWGLNDTIRGICDRLAQTGFVAFAPDLYEGRVTDQIAEAEKLVGAMETKLDQTRARLDEALAFLQEQAGASESGVSVIGFSMGAFYALDLSANAPESVHSVVVFYGAGGADFSKAKASYLAHFAESDPYEPQESLDYLENALKTAGRPLTLYTYPGTGHWFFEPDRQDAYNEAASALAWERTITFLNRTQG